MILSCQVIDHLGSQRDVLVEVGPFRVPLLQSVEGRVEGRCESVKHMPKFSTEHKFEITIEVSMHCYLQEGDKSQEDLGFQVGCDGQQVQRPMKAASHKSHEGSDVSIVAPRGMLLDLSSKLIPSVKLDPVGFPCLKGFHLRCKVGREGKGKAILANLQQRYRDGVRTGEGSGEIFIIVIRLVLRGVASGAASLSLGGVVLWEPPLLLLIRDILQVRKGLV